MINDTSILQLKRNIYEFYKKRQSYIFFCLVLCLSLGIWWTFLFCSYVDYNFFDRNIVVIILIHIINIKNLLQIDGIILSWHVCLYEWVCIGENKRNMHVWIWPRFLYLWNLGLCAGHTFLKTLFSKVSKHEKTCSKQSICFNNLCVWHFWLPNSKNCGSSTKNSKGHAKQCCVSLRSKDVVFKRINFRKG